MKEILYLSFDSLQEGVGASQVLAYMQKVAKIRPVRIVSFEKFMPTQAEIDSLKEVRITWQPLPFGNFGAIGGLKRLIQMRREIKPNQLIHARSTLPALAALLRPKSYFIWDCRSLQADQRRALSNKKTITPSFLLFRTIESILAKRSQAIIVITKSVIPILISRYSIEKEKITHITTCVDTNAFYKAGERENGVLKILLSGTFSPAYDIVLINKIIKKIRSRRAVEVTVATSQGSTSHWEQLEYDQVISLKHQEMPRLIQEHDLGISIWRNDLGICLKSVASTKTAEFLACGKPILINSNQGDFGRLIRENRLGIVTNLGDDFQIESYVNELDELLLDRTLAERCRNFALENLSLELAVFELIKLYKALD
jgi:glycosyltransferase involved in cell wall biosynthesis